MAIVNNHCAGGVKETARLASLAEAAVIRIAMLDMPEGESGGRTRRTEGLRDEKGERCREREGELELGARSLYKASFSMAGTSNSLSAMSYFLLLEELGFMRRKSNVGLAGGWRGRSNTDKPVEIIVVAPPCFSLQLLVPNGRDDD